MDSCDNELNYSKELISKPTLFTPLALLTYENANIWWVFHISLTWTMLKLNPHFLCCRNDSWVFLGQIDNSSKYYICNGKWCCYCRCRVCSFLGLPFQSLHKRITIFNPIIRTCHVQTNSDIFIFINIDCFSRQYKVSMWR